MKKYHIPTAAYETFSDPEAAEKYLETAKFPIVLKADGLALGKGVLICNTLEEAKEGVKTIMLDKKFGSAGNEMVIEEFMTGREVSVLSFVDGKTIKTMSSAQDHKRAGDGDTGLNTGGMAQTGMEAVEILRGTAEQTHPDVILAVDALAACSIHRLNCTIQLADTGIWPGSGVGNHRNALNQETLGVPVIGIGVPTVVGAGTIVHDAVAGVLESLEESEMDEFLGEVISPALESLYVTTKEIDEMVRRLAGVLAAGMNQAFSGEM